MPVLLLILVAVKLREDVLTALSSRISAPPFAAMLFLRCGHLLHVIRTFAMAGTVVNPFMENMRPPPDILYFPPPPDSD